MWKGWESQLIADDDTNTYYLEFSSTAASGGYPAVIIGDPTSNPWNVNTIVWNTESGETSYSGTSQAAWTGATYSSNAVAGFTYNVSTGVVAGFINGVQAGTFTMPDSVPRVFGFGAPPQDIPIVDYNFGQKPFLHQPAGTVALQTQNLPEATIRNGRDHFRAITGPGQGGYQLFSSQSRDETLGIADFTEEGPCPGSTVQAEQFILDCFGDVTTTEFIISQGWGWLGGNARISVSADGSANSWTVTNADEPMPNGGTITITSGTDFRYVKLYYLSNSGGVNFGDITTTNNPILAQAQGAFDTGLWIVKDRDNASTQFQLVDSVRGDNALIKKCPGLANTAAYAPPAGNCVAWCWNAPDEMDEATRLSGDIDVTAGRVNQAAGFSILEFEGNTLNDQTIAHGLTQAPEFVIAVAHDNTNSIPAWHAHAPGAPTNGTGLLNSGRTLDLTHVDASDNQFLTISGNAAINSDTVSMYLWHSVPGYSAFGSYQSNVNDDGPFVYLGFRPALVITTNADQNTTMGFTPKDTTRAPLNLGNGLRLGFNQDAAETTHNNEAIDLLSNGFKIRGTSDSQNAPDVNRTFVYCAWAENPFGSSNTSPANAR